MYKIEDASETTGVLNRIAILLWENSKQVFQVCLVGSVPEQRRDAKNLFHGPQGGAMRVMDGVGVAMSFGKGRKHNHADWAVAPFTFVPCNKNGAACLIRR